MARAVVDWGAMEPDWRAGIKSVLQLSAEHGVSRAAIIKHWAKAGIERDVTAKIRAKAEALVTQSMVTPEVTQRQNVTERQIVESNAQAMAGVIRGQHKVLARLGGIIQKLFDRLESELEGTELFAQLGEIMANQDESGGTDKLNDLYRKVIALPTQTDVAKKLAETLKTHIELERKVFRIDEQKTVDDNPLAGLIKAINGSALPVVAGRLDD